MSSGSLQLQNSILPATPGVTNGAHWKPKFLSLQCGRRWNPRPGASKLVAFASASSAAGSGREYSEELLERIKEKGKKKIAGIDQDELVDDPEHLADPDSCFCEFNGVKIHHKVYDAVVSQQHESSNQSLNLNIPMILLHGFGASIFSWNRALKPLAEATGSRVLAFDRPAFGLTSRVDLSSLNVLSGGEDARPLNPYSMAFSVLATLYFINFLAADKAILVGHSAGSLVAVNTYFEAPERVAALILVAPAIFAPNPPPRENQPKDEKSNFEKAGENNLISRLFTSLSRIAKYIGEVIIRMVTGMTKMLSSLYKKVLSTILRSALGIMLVRMLIDKFGISAIKIAWHDQKQITDHVLQGYTKPLRSKGWDRALVEYTVAMLLDVESESKPPIGKRLHEISCPVLIITGDNDRIVPSWNAKRLSRVIPGSVLKVIKHCGHLPHEEKVEEFVSVVRNFLLKTLGSSEEQLFQQALV
ncbi:uncharacterized protein LOC116196019 [Punica granatum]|uniref:AB hydrolase-1 domain-containing protein n=2 Tax=Punica granatum TaxID=22663 RepID=A0A218WCC5_PUNGR|nr:uncharacterized protein LOC116196019 [Punica granatum]XP_031381385.1 uncharacterized protein LOC116196019 [Punica granatum]OWM69851.1 hypothetical protein CDL15_Pgr025700 [Punica granatum]PKI64913.1 hypothetical protein CRG98_014709 [Punica granatum]